MYMIYLIAAINVIALIVQYMIFASINVIARKNADADTAINLAYGVHFISALSVVILIIINIWLVKQIVE